MIASDQFTENVMTHFIEALETALNSVERAKAHAASRWYKFQNLFACPSKSAWLTICSTAVLFVASPIASLSLHMPIVFLGGMGAGVLCFFLGLHLTERARCFKDTKNSTVFTVDNETSATQRVEILEQCHAAGATTRQIQALQTIAKRNDVPSAWWRFVKHVAQEELRRQQDEQDQHTQREQERLAHQKLHTPLFVDVVAERPVPQEASSDGRLKL